MLFACVLIASLVSVESTSEHPLVLVVSLDGFRSSYLGRGRTPFLDSLRDSSAYCASVTSVFPTITFTNHYSIATGVYSEVHGVLMNPPRTTDEDFGEDSWGDAYWHYDEDVVPIWILNELHGPGRHSGVSMWPGGGEQYLNTTPTFYCHHNNSTPPKQRIDTAIAWFLNETTPANLVMLYINDPDATAHVYGPDSPQVLRQLRLLDEATKHLYSRLQENQLLDRVNVLLVSDHGMTTVKQRNIIDLSGPLQGVQNVQRGSSPILHFDSGAETEERLYEILLRMSRTNNFTVYRKADLLDRWHFKHNRRVGQLVTVADEGYVFHDFHQKIEYYKKNKSLTVMANSTFGEHGYDNRLPSMRAFLIAFGPDIQMPYKSEGLHLVDVFPLIGSLLRMCPVPASNGSLSAAWTMLAAAPASLASPTLLISLSAILVWTHNMLPS